MLTDLNIFFFFFFFNWLGLLRFLLFRGFSLKIGACKFWLLAFGRYFFSPSTIYLRGRLGQLHTRSFTTCADSCCWFNSTHIYSIVYYFYFIKTLTFILIFIILYKYINLIIMIYILTLTLKFEIYKV